MPQNAAFHQGLQCLLKLKQFLGTEGHLDLEIQTCDQFISTINHPRLKVRRIEQMVYMRIQNIILYKKMTVGRR